MNFAVGDEVTIQTSARSFWHGIKAKVSRVDSDEEEFPYDLLLLEDTKNKNFTKGETIPAFRESELVPTDVVVQTDLEKAKELLAKHGFAFRIYTREDVDRMLDLYAQDENEPLDTRTFREEIVDHVMKGDDWPDMSKKGYDDESTLWQIIEGTRHDHPEWFVG